MHSKYIVMDFASYSHKKGYFEWFLPQAIIIIVYGGFKNGKTKQKNKFLHKKICLCLIKAFYTKN